MGLIANLTFLLDYQHVCQTFDIESFDQLQNKIDTMAPSIVEYYLSDLASTVDGDTTLNPYNIQYKINFQEYSLMLDYDDHIYLEFSESNSEYETESLW